jgi:O-antigen/teichoic acid export membrane protein
MDIIKKGLSSVIYNLLGASVGLFTQFYAAKVLGVVEFGEFNYFMGIANSIALIFSFGISFYFPKIFQVTYDKKKLFSQFFYSFVIIFLVFFPICFILMKPNIDDNNDIFLLVTICFLIISIGYYRAFLIGVNKAHVSAKVNNFLLKLFVLVVFVIIYNFYDKSSHSLIYAVLICNLIILIPFLKNTLTKVRPSFSFIKGSILFYLIQLLYSFFNEYSKVLQSDLFNYEAVSYLSIALLLGQVLVIFGQNFANVSLPTFAKAYIDKDFDLMAYTFRSATRINAYFLIPVFSFFFLNSEFILSLIGENYVKGSLMLKFILCGTFIGSIVGPNGSVLLMTNKGMYELVNGILKIFIVILVLVFYAQNFIWGIAFSIAISEILINLVKSFELYYLYRIFPFNKKEGFYLLFIFILSFFIFYLISNCINGSINIIAVNFFVGFSLLFLSFYFSPNSYDRVFLMKTIKLKVK